MKQRTINLALTTAAAALLAASGCSTVSTAARETGNAAARTAHKTGDAAATAVHGAGHAISETAEEAKDEMTD